MGPIGNLVLLTRGAWSFECLSEVPVRVVLVVFSFYSHGAALPYSSSECLISNMPTTTIVYFTLLFFRTA